MSNRFVFEGLAELREQLRNLPANLKGEASRDADATGNSAAVEIRTEYGRHNVTGDLQDGVTVTRIEAGRFGAGVIVKSASKHAWLFDNGSQTRQYFSKNQKAHSTGKMWGRIPPTHVFGRTMGKSRRRFYEKLKDLLTRNGLQVSGNG